jgi:hypothetical protein
MCHAETEQELADEACSSLPAFTTANIDAPSGATPTSGKAVTPHTQLLIRAEKSKNP